MMTKTLLSTGLTAHVDSKMQFELITQAIFSGNYGNCFVNRRKLYLKYQTLKLLFSY